MTQPLPTRGFAAFLFDMDGTILTSIAATERCWGAWARRHGLDVEAFLPTIHGQRAIDTIARLNLPGVDPIAEAHDLLQAEMEDMGGIEAISGASAFLGALPPERWAIVTSAPRDLALRRLAAAGLPPSATMITAEDVTRGKPEPDCFLLGAERLGVDIRDCAVFEDAPAGIKAAEASGASVVVITALHTHPVDVPHATLKGYDGLAAAADGHVLRLTAKG